MRKRHTYVETPVGALLLVAEREEPEEIEEVGEPPEPSKTAASGETAAPPAGPAQPDALRGIYFPGHWYPPEARDIGERVDAEADALFRAAAAQLAEYFAGDRREFDLPLRTHGDEFSEQVWRILRDIPYGETTTYGAIAVALGNRNFAQRVGQCVGHNPISIVIPCHRVVGADGSLTGFAGGLERKRFLLELEEPEEVSASRLF